MLPDWTVACYLYRCLEREAREARIGNEVAKENGGRRRERLKFEVVGGDEASFGRRSFEVGVNKSDFLVGVKFEVEEFKREGRELMSSG